MQINRSLRTLFFINSIFVFAGAFLGPLYAVYVQEIDERVFTVSVSWAVFMLSATFFMWLVARNSNKIKEKEFLLAGGFLVRAIAWFGYAFIGNVAGLIFTQILLGLGEALGTPSWNAIFADHLNKNKEIMEYSEWNIIQNIFVAVGTAIGGLLVTLYGFKILFFLMSFLALVSFVGTLITPRRVL